LGSSTTWFEAVFGTAGVATTAVGFWLERRFGAAAGWSGIGHRYPFRVGVLALVGRLALVLGLAAVLVAAMVILLTP
jgi:hypothetical protein